MRAMRYLIFITITGLTLSGCAAHRTESAAGERVSLDYSPGYSVVLAPMTSVTVSRARVYQEGEYFVVSGRVKRMHEVQLPGHVDLAICGPDGTLLGQKATRVSGLSSNRKGALELPFRFRLAMVPPESATIHLKYHPLSSGDVELTCENF